MAGGDDGMGPEELFPLDRRSVAAACRFMADAFGGSVVDSGNLVRMVGELAAEAVVYAHTAFGVRIRIAPLPIRVEFQDRSPSPPIARHFDQEYRGASRVDLFASAWGVIASGDGKLVWFEYLPRDRI